MLYPVHDAITDVPGIHVGHAQNRAAATGCTVVLLGNGAVTGADVRGGSPGTREISALDPVNAVKEAHAVYLGGGSAFGLDGACGVMEYLEEMGIGFPVDTAVVPIVPSAVLFDLKVGLQDVRPDKAMGYEACKSAATPNTEQGNVGAGTGCYVGMAAGPDLAMKGGLGTASIRLSDLIVGALAAVNCFGDVVDPETGRVIAGVMTPDKKGFAGTINLLSRAHREGSPVFSGGNTTLGVVATNARLSQAEATKIAMMAHDGFARTINPIHTMYDGDTIFCTDTGEVKTDLTTLGALAAEVMGRAIVKGIKAAESAYGFMSATDFAGVNYAANKGEKPVIEY